MAPDKRTRAVDLRPVVIIWPRLYNLVANLTLAGMENVPVTEHASCPILRIKNNAPKGAGRPCGVADADPRRENRATALAIALLL